MLTFSRFGGADQLRLFLGDLRPGQALEILGISERTLRRYLSGQVEIPQSVFQALYWHTRWGSSEIESRSGFELVTLRGLVGAQRDQLARLAVLPAANGDRWQQLQRVK